LRRIIAPEWIPITVFLIVTSPRIHRHIAALLVFVILVELLKIDEVGLPFIIIVKDAPQGGQPLLAIK